MLELGLEFAKLAQVACALLLVGCRGHGGLALVQAHLQLMQAGHTPQRVLEERLLLVCRLGMLAHVADGGLAHDGDTPGIGEPGAEDQLEERALAGAVGADNAYALAGIDPEVDVAKDILRAVVDADVLKINHAHMIP